MSSTKHCANKDLDAAIIFTPDQPNQDLSVEGNADSHLLFVVMRQRLAIRLLQLNLHVREHRHVILRYRTMVSQSCMYDSEKKKRRTLYSMLNSPLPCVAPRNWLEYPNISFNATSATAENSSSRTSLSTIVPRRAFSPPITAPECQSTYNQSKHDNLIKKKKRTHFGTRQARRLQLS